MEAIRFHIASKHLVGRFAAGPGKLDWKNQPNPFREYLGSVRIPLQDGKDQVDSFTFGDLFPEAVSSRPTYPRDMDIATISQMLRHSLGVSCLKRYSNGNETVLRVNPSSGNLHPTEAYLISPPHMLGQGLVAHYNVEHHELEVRKKLAFPMSGMESPDVLYLALTSIPWRESWKYGERAFRYCQLDLGHALASIEVSCAMLGWHTKMVVGNCQFLVAGLGLPNGEEPECLVRVSKQPTTAAVFPQALMEALSSADLEIGNANQLSKEEIEWPAIQRVLENTREPPVSSATGHSASTVSRSKQPLPPLYHQCSLVKICHQRRSALDYDPTRPMSQSQFYSFLEREIPFNMLLGKEFEPSVHYCIFVHNVDGLDPGLYLFVRNPTHLSELQSTIHIADGEEGEAWSRPNNCPVDHFYLLARGNAQRVARLLSCNQDIAADSCFSLGMLARFQNTIQAGWDYKRLFWECGMLGQALYLTAELHGARGTGIGCFLDDEMHKILGLTNSTEYQSLYHFTVGFGLHDSRIVTTRAF
ncbi:hypothetical protein BASA81_000078 [Batrachochytrium salamandrivorans]|nr:hypothetical protein BASA81_000078 [Batrachochytrium salamandrivorans]